MKIRKMNRQNQRFIISLPSIRQHSLFNGSKHHQMHKNLNRKLRGWTFSSRQTMDYSFLESSKRYLHLRLWTTGCQYTHRPTVLWVAQIGVNSVGKNSLGSTNFLTVSQYKYCTFLKQANKMVMEVVEDIKVVTVTLQNFFTLRASWTMYHQPRTASQSTLKAGFIILFGCI